MPRGKRTRSPSTSAPPSRRTRSASGSLRNSTPTSSRIVSALRSMSARPSSSRTSNGSSVRVRNGVRSTCAWSRAARRARGRRALRCGVVGHVRFLDRLRLRGAPPLPAAAGTATARRRRAVGARRPPRGSGDGACGAGNARASTKCSWKRGSTAVSIFSTRRVTSSISRRCGRQQRDERAGPGGVAGGLHAVEVAVGDEPEDHRVERVDLAAERAGEPDLVDGLDAGVVHQQARAGVERGLGELDRADVVLGDEDARLARRGARTRTCGRPGRCAAVRAASDPSMTPSG